MKSMKSACKASAAKKLAGYRKGYANGGAVSPLAAMDDDLEPIGGSGDMGDGPRIDGVPVRQRMDKAMKSPAKTNINITIAAPAKDEKPPMPMAPPVVPPGVPPMAGPPPMPPMMPPGAMARKNGGRIDPKAAVHKHEAKHHKGEGKTKFASGGRISDYIEGRSSSKKAGAVLDGLSTAGNLGAAAVSGPLGKAAFLPLAGVAAKSAVDNYRDSKRYDKAAKRFKDMPETSPEYGGRKNGGKVEGGAGGGLGRLAKAADAKRK